MRSASPPPSPSASGGYEHLDLYRHGYRSIDTIGSLFAVNVIVSAGFVGALVTRRDPATRLGALGFTVLSVAAFVLSRTSGLFGFTERGLSPRPQAPTTLAAEMIATLLLAAALIIDVTAQRHHALALHEVPAEELPPARTAVR